MVRSERKTEDDPASVTPDHAAAKTAAVHAPIEIDLRKRTGRKKKKRRTSDGLRDAEEFGRRSTRATTRFASAVAKGFRAYEKRRDESARKKRDGAIRDALENWSRGAGVTMRAASRVPYDVARAVNTRTIRRQTRCAARSLSLPFFR